MTRRRDVLLAHDKELDVAEPRQAESDPDGLREANLEALPERGATSPPPGTQQRSAAPQQADGDLAGVRHAMCEGFAEGLRDHLPGAVGIAVKGLPLCLFGAFAHEVLDVTAAHTIGGVLAGGAIQFLRSRAPGPEPRPRRRIYDP